MYEPLNWFFYTCLLLTLHILLQSRTFNIWPDWDSASHLYYAYLRRKGVIIESSYSYGIKWILPRLYEILGGLWEGRIFDHRIINTISGCFLIIQFSFLAFQDSYEYGAFFLFFITLLINSLYINYQTSSTEFIDTPIILFLLGLSRHLPTSFYILIPLCLIIVLSFTFKAVDIIYLLPILAFHYKGILDNPILLLIIFSTISFSLFILLKHGVKGTNIYSKTRVLLNPKGMRYIVLNPIWVSLNLLVSIQIIYQQDVFSSATIIAAWLCILSQKMLVTYFWYPIVIFNSLFWLQLDLEFIGFIQIFFYIVFFWLCVGSCASIFMNKQYIEPFFRQFFMGENGLKRFATIKSEMKSVAWIKKNINKDKSIYLWGSKTVIPLMAKLSHIEKTYYSHNHLFYWSRIQDKLFYARNIIQKFKPDYVFESGIINRMAFQSLDFEGIYSIVYELDDLRIYKKKELLD